MKRDYALLKEAIQIDYEEKLEALEKLRGYMGGADEEVKAPRARTADLPDDEKKARKKAYMKSWYAKHKTGKKSPHRNGDDEKGIPARKWKKLLVPGPLAAGGNGEE